MKIKLEVNNVPVIKCFILVPDFQRYSRQVSWNEFYTLPAYSKCIKVHSLLQQLLYERPKNKINQRLISNIF